MSKYFGTDGIRGPVGGAFINTDFAYRLGSGLGKYLKREHPHQILRVVIGRDTRSSGPGLADALTQGFNQQGLQVYDLGVAPTPSIARSVLQEHADFGIAVTASHNPVSDNGIKLFDRNACKLETATECQIEALVDAEPTAPAHLPAAQAESLESAAEYVRYIQSLMAPNCLSDWKIVLDLANGGTSQTTPAAMTHFGAELILVGNQPDGNNINEGVGSEHPELLCQRVLEHGANIGIAHDGDGDRLVVCDDKGVLLEGDTLLGLFAVHALRSGTLKNKVFVATIQSNLGLDHTIHAAGGCVERADVGDRNVAHLMRNIGASIGGESSGHVIFSELSTTGDGLLAAVKLIDLICQAKQPLSELRNEIALFPQATASLHVAEKKPLASLDTLNARIAAIEEELGNNGRVLVRYSGTEPRLRLLVEGKDEVRVNTLLNDLENSAQVDLNLIHS